MKIGVDISAIQGPHRMRGIGFTVINFINHVAQVDKEKIHFVFYMHENGQEEALELLKTTGMSFAVRTIYPRKPIGHTRRIIRYSKKIISGATTLYSLIFGNTEGADFTDLDWFLQFDQNKPLPPKNKVKSIIIAYDLIPYVLEYLYLNNYSTARRTGKSRLESLTAQLKRSSYIWKIRVISKKAVKIIAISEHTKHDLIEYAHVKKSKIKVCYLGASGKSVDLHTPDKLYRFNDNPWGNIPEEVPLPTKPFLLFIGGADPRRKLIDLVAAFNNLRARGVDIQLILCGDTMFGQNKVGNPELQKYLKDSAYVDDIYFLGFINEATKEWLYKHALAFVYPSLYEGFGLPIIEAIRYKTNVITLDNSSIKEVGGSSVIYFKTMLDLIDIILELVDNKSYAKTQITSNDAFNWSTFTANIFMSTNVPK